MARRKPKTELRQRSEAAWEKSYQAYLRKREEVKAQGIAVENRMSRSLFKEIYTQNYEKHHKSIIRDIVKGDVLVSGAQSKAISRGFKQSRISEWINKARAEGTIISEDVESKLLSFRGMSAKKIRSPEFRKTYEELYPFIQQYNRSGVGRNVFTELIGGSP